MGEEETHRRRRWPWAVGVLCAAVLGCVGAAFGAARSTADGLAQASHLRAQSQFGSAISLYDKLAARSGPLYILARSDVDNARREAQLTLLDWAASLAREGHVDQALIVAGGVTDPALRSRSAAERASLLLDAAKADAAKKAYGPALVRLGQLRTLGGPSSVMEQVTKLTPAYQIAEAVQLTGSGDGIDAVTLLKSASDQGQASAATAHMPAALLAAANQEIGYESWKEAAADLQSIIAGFPGAPEAAQAQALLRQPQTVVGTLVDKAGHPFTGRVRLSSHYVSLPGGYTTTGPFYYSTADARGDFSFSGIPVGGPYTFEIFRNGDWTTFVDPKTNQPATPVNVAGLIPVDLTFVVVPS